jgi:hypothetical protein
MLPEFLVSEKYERNIQQEQENTDRKTYELSGNDRYADDAAIQQVVRKQKGFQPDGGYDGAQEYR